MAICSEGKFAYPTGKAGAEALGYDPVFISEAPGIMLKSFCGVGNPFSLGEIHPGENVLDIGSGSGFDLYVAGRLAGESGRVCGVDLTQEMVDLSRQSLEKSGRQNFEVTRISGEAIPYRDNTFDTVISNGVINLSPCKQELFREIFRVLKKGGKLQFADVVLEKELPGRLVGSAEAWSQ